MPRFEMRLRCDSCDFECDDMRDADDHEDSTLDHWVQWVQVDVNDD